MCMRSTAVRGLAAALAAASLLAACSETDSSRSQSRPGSAANIGESSTSSPNPVSKPPKEEAWRTRCPGVRPRFDVYTPGLRGEATVDRAAESWLLPNEQVGRKYTQESGTRMVEIVHRARVARVLETVRTKRQWLPESVTACHAAILRGRDASPRCSPHATSARSVKYRQSPVEQGPQLGISLPIMMLRVLRCGVVLPGQRLLSLETDIWPVTSYTRSEESPAEGQLISIVVARGPRGQRYFPTEYAGTS